MLSLQQKKTFDAQTRGKKATTQMLKKNELINFGKFFIRYLPNMIAY